MLSDMVYPLIHLSIHVSKAGQATTEYIDSGGTALFQDF